MQMICCDMVCFDSSARACAAQSRNQGEGIKSVSWAVLFFTQASPYIVFMEVSAVVDLDGVAVAGGLFF